MYFLYIHYKKSNFQFTFNCKNIKKNLMKHFSSKEIKKQKKKTMDIDYGILYMKIKANLHHLKQTSHAYI